MWVSGKRLPVLLLIVAVVFIVIGALMANLNIGFWGLIHSYSVIYFVGLGLLTLSFITTIRLGRLNRSLLICQTLVFLIALWLLPVMVGSHPGYQMAYRNLGLVNNIAEQGLTVIKTHYYLACPAFHIFFGGLAGWFGIDFEPLIPIFPFIMQFLYLLPLFVFLRNVLGADKEKYCWIGLWVYTLGNWTGQDYFSPQSVGLLLLLIILALVTHRAFEMSKRRVKAAMYLVILVLFGLLVATHLLTSLATICLLGAYILVRKKWKLVVAIGICVLIVIVWDCTLGFNYLVRAFEGAEIVPEQYYTETMRMRGLIGYTSAITFDPELILRTNITASISGSESHAEVVRVRIAYAMGFGIVMGLGVLYMLFRKRSSINITMLIMALSLLILLPLRYAGWELSQRIYMFELPFVAYFGVMLLGIKKRWFITSLCTLFVLLSVPFFVCHYGNQAVDYWSENHKEGYRYVVELQKNSGRWVGELRFISLKDGEVLYDGQTPRSIPYYMPISKYDDAVYSFIYNKPEFIDDIWSWFKNSPRYESFYQNPEFEIFRSIVLD